MAERLVLTSVAARCSSSLVVGQAYHQCTATLAKLTSVSRVDIIQFTHTGPHHGFLSSSSGSGLYTVIYVSCSSLSAAVNDVRTVQYTLDTRRLLCWQTL